MEPMGEHHKPEDPGFTPTIRASFKRTRCLPALGGLLLLNIALKFLVAGTGFAKIVNIGIFRSKQVSRFRALFRIPLWGLAVWSPFEANSRRDRPVRLSLRRIYSEATSPK